MNLSFLANKRNFITVIETTSTTITHWRLATTAITHCAKFIFKSVHSRIGIINSFIFGKY